MPTNAAISDILAPPHLTDAPWPRRNGARLYNIYLADTHISRQNGLSAGRFRWKAVDHRSNLTQYVDTTIGFRVLRKELCVTASWALWKRLTGFAIGPQRYLNLCANSKLSQLHHISSISYIAESKKKPYPYR